MIFILNGLNSFGPISQHVFVKTVLTLNNYETIKIDGYTIKFLNDFDNFEIYNKTKKLVYSQSNSPLDEEQTGIIKIFDENPDIFEKAKNISEELHDNLKSLLNFKTSFLDPFDMDFGKKIDKKVYDNIMKAYQKRKFKDLVIRGEFSVDILEQLRKDIGPKKVIVLNFIRNPSGHYFTEKRYLTYRKKYGPVEDDNYWPIMLENSSKSMINALELSTFDFIKTVKTEEILEKGFLDILDKRIHFNFQDIMHNKYVTKLEYEELVGDDFEDTNETVEEYNQKYLNFEPTLEDIFTDEEWNNFSVEYFKRNYSEKQLNLINEEYQKKYSNKNFFEELSKGNITKLTDILGLVKIAGNIDFDSEKILNFFPVNVFEKLNYTPLTYDEMVS